jgi:hypothetical protein
MGELPRDVPAQSIMREIRAPRAIFPRLFINPLSA